MKIFISQPMNGLSEEQIKENRRDAEKKVLDYLKNHLYDIENIVFLNTIFEEEPNKEFKNQSLWYLGKSIQFLGQADIAFFFGDWQNYRGCVVEHVVADNYNINIVDMSKD